MWDVRVVPGDDPDLRALIDELSELLAARYGSSGRSGFDPDAADREAVFVVASTDGEPVACGALRPLPDGVGEVKRMFSRRRGGGHRVHAVLERIAAERGYCELWLETRRANDVAIAFYERLGYRERAPYGRYVGRPEAICLSKSIAMDPTDG